MQYIRVHEIYYPNSDNTVFVSAEVVSLDEVKSLYKDNKNVSVSTSFLCLPETLEEIKLGSPACIGNDRLNLIRNLELNERDLFILSNGSSIT